MGDYRRWALLRGGARGGTLFEALNRIYQAGVSMLLIEQNVRLALDVSQRTYVLENGRIVAEGASSDIQGRPEIQRAYLGLDA